MRKAYYVYIIALDRTTAFCADSDTEFEDRANETWGYESWELLEKVDFPEKTSA